MVVGGRWWRGGRDDETTVKGWTWEMEGGREDDDTTRKRWDRLLGSNPPIHLPTGSSPHNGVSPPAAPQTLLNWPPRPSPSPCRGLSIQCCSMLGANIDPFRGRISSTSLSLDAIDCIRSSAGNRWQWGFPSGAPITPSFKKRRRGADSLFLSSVWP